MQRLFEALFRKFIVLSQLPSLQQGFVEVQP